MLRQINGEEIGAAWMPSTEIVGHLADAVINFTVRPESTREAAKNNLREAGYTECVKAVLKPNEMKMPSAADYKGPVRCELIAQGYNIVANMGDQPSDLAGGCAEKTFLLPNPFYRIP
jgi:HAD superfamily, subfamily IIIB (Acid phosphatase)